MNPRQLVLTLALILPLSLSAPLGPARGEQDAEKKPGPPCDVATVEDAVWCPKCKKPREAAQTPMYVSWARPVSKSERSASQPRPSRRACQTPASVASAAT